MVYCEIFIQLRAVATRHWRYTPTLLQCQLLNSVEVTNPWLAGPWSPRPTFCTSSKLQVYTHVVHLKSWTEHQRCVIISSTLEQETITCHHHCMLWLLLLLLLHELVYCLTLTAGLTATGAMGWTLTGASCGSLQSSVWLLIVLFLVNIHHVTLDKQGHSRKWNTWNQFPFLTSCAQYSTFWFCRNPRIFHFHRPPGAVTIPSLF